MILDSFILGFLIIFALWTVMTRSLLRSGIGLALTSVILSVIMFRLNAPLAAVLELSVCAGFISVVFLSTISLTHPLNRQENLQVMKEKFSRFWPLPLSLLIAAVVMGLLQVKPEIIFPAAKIPEDVGFILWHVRKIDIIGQIIIVLAGIFGVAVLFKEIRKQ